MVHLTSCDSESGFPLVVLAWAFHRYDCLYCDTNDAMIDSSTNCGKAYVYVV
jgi:hypothetical protein